MCLCLILSSCSSVSISPSINKNNYDIGDINILVTTNNIAICNHYNGVVIDTISGTFDRYESKGDILYIYTNKGIYTINRNCGRIIGFVKN